MPKFGKEARQEWPVGCGIAFFIFALLFNLGWMGLLVWLIIEAIQWLGRH